MNVKIRDIPEAGLELQQPLGPAFLADALAGLPADLGRSRGEVTLRVTRDDDNVFVRGQVTGETHVECVRCLREVRLPLEATIDLIYLPEGEEGPGDDDGEVSEVQQDYATHDGKEIRLDGELREALILSLPLNPLCRPDCQGLCPQCGEDRNQRLCGCSVGAEDPRLAPLRNLKI